MTEHFHVTSIGYSHVRAGKVCQDHSSSYSDGERTIITACDGHGGDVYVRSHKGSKFASLAMLRAMLDAQELSFRKYRAEEIEHNLKLNILCEWNRLVQEDLAEHPLRKSEVAHLTAAQQESLKQNPAKAYGTTLGGAMLNGNRLVCVGLGDGGCFLVKNGEIASAFPDDGDEPVANVTHSLCEEDAFEHMHARIFDVRQFDGILLCTDGVLGPYQSTENFKRSFVLPVIRRVLDGKTEEVKQFVRDLGLRSGIGDDVSLAMIVKASPKSRHYS